MSESSFNRARFAPSLDAIPSPSQPSSLESFFDEPTVEFDAAVLADMLARSDGEVLEETRSYQIPAEVLALARGEQTVSAGHAAARAWPGSPFVMPLAHVIATALAVALGYFLVQIIDG